MPMSNEMSKPLGGPIETVCASGLVENVVLRHNTAGRPWAEFLVITAGGVARCVCFPRHYDRFAGLITVGTRLRVCGQLARADPCEMRVTQIAAQ